MSRPGAGRLPAHYPNDFDTLGHGLIYADAVFFVVGALVALGAL